MNGKSPLAGALTEAAHPSCCSESTPRCLVIAASTAELAAALTIPVAEIDVWFTSEIAPCPRCQPSASHLLISEPAAVVETLGLSCFACLTRTTRWSLESRVLSDADALDRLALSSQLVVAS